MVMKYNGYSLHIGLNQVDHTAYGEIASLEAAVNDAHSWQQFARKKGFITRLFTDKRAKVAPVKRAFNKLAKTANPGDLILISYSGHGSEIANDLPGREVPEAFDQTWCLYDRQLLDDELYELFSHFKKGVRITVVSDSCHSGTVTRDINNLGLNELLHDGLQQLAENYGFRSKELPVKNATINALNADAAYRELQKHYSTLRLTIGASVKLLAACQDDEVTYDGEKNGLFTQTMLALLADKKWSDKNAKELIFGSSTFYSYPRPNFFEYGSRMPSFDKYSPFQIQVPEADKVTAKIRVKKQNFILVNNTNPRSFVDLRSITPSRILITYDATKNIHLTGNAQYRIVSSYKSENKIHTEIELTNVSVQNEWTAIHAIHQGLVKYDPGVTITPLYNIQPGIDPRVSRAADKDHPDYLDEWPPAQDIPAIPVGWHLDEGHSQLRLAHTILEQEKPGAHIKIAHLDTGYLPHKSLPVNLDINAAHSFVEGDNPNEAIDKPGSGGQEGHGLGTLVLLAGGQVKKEDIFGEFEGVIGGAPAAQVVPVRISDSVVIWKTSHFCAGVDYAIAQGCEVITMSMAGKPDKDMADAVNRAYEAGVVIVSAAGNNWYKGLGALLPKCVLFPAAFPQVIAATGVMYNQKPYNYQFQKKNRAISTHYMQGSYGPASRMKKALAAYTPNTPWATTGIPFVKSGGGTSSATPQIAAAVALWIAYHREELVQKGYYKPGHQWKKVEAAHHALYKVAAKGDAFSEWERYYGNGILRAAAAIRQGVADENQLVKAKDARVILDGWGELLTSLFDPFYRFKSIDVIPPEAIAAELLDVMQRDPALFSYFEMLDFTDQQNMQGIIDDIDFRNKVIHSRIASPFLKQTIRQYAP